MLNYFPEDVFDRIKAKYESILKFLTWSFALCADGHFEHELQEHAACPVWDVKCWAPVGQAHIGGGFFESEKMLKCSSNTCVCYTCRALLNTEVFAKRLLKDHNISTGPRRN